MGMSYLGIRKWCDRITAFDALRSCLRVEPRAFWEEGCGGRLGIERRGGGWHANDISDLLRKSAYLLTVG